MNRSSTLFAVASLVLLSAAAAHAQGATSFTKPISIGISAGVAVPMGNLSNGTSSGFSGTNTGYDITGSVAFALPALPFNLRVDANYNKFGTKNIVFPAINSPGTGVQPANAPPQGGYNADVRVLSFTANVVYPLPLPALLIHPYLIGGAGIYNVVQEPTAGGNYSQTNAGYDLGAGATLPLGALNAFVEARYQRVNQHSGSIAFVPITLGVMF